MRLPTLAYQGRFRLIWDCLILCLSLWTSVTVPFQAAFALSTSWSSYVLISSISCDALFLLDLCLNFLTTYTDPQSGDEVLSPRLIASHYLRSWSCLFDSIASIPWTLVDFLLSANSSAAALCRLMRLLRVSSLLIKMKAKEGLKNTVRFVQILLIFVLITHWTTCIFRVVVRASGDTWVSTRDLFYPPHDMYTDTAFRLYFFFSYYSSLVVQTGGDIYPLSLSEIITVTVLELVNLVLSTLLYSNMLGVIGRTSDRSGRVHAKLDTLHNMYTALQLPSKLIKLIDLYAMKAEYSYLDVEQQSKFLANLPPSIYIEVTKWLMTEILDTNACLRDLDTVNMEKLVKGLKSGMSTPEEMMFEQGQKGEKTYFLTSGKLDLLVAGTEELEILEEVKCGSHFGFCSLLTATHRYSYSACSLAYNSYSYIRNEDLMTVISSEIAVYEEMKREELRRHEGLRSLIQGIAAQIPYLQGLKENPEGLFQLQAMLRTQIVTEKDVVIGKGQPNNAVYYVYAGVMGLVLADTLVVEELPAGSIFGLYSVFSDRPQPYNFRSLSKFSTIMCLDRADLQLLGTVIPGLQAARAIYKHLKRDDYVKNIMYALISEYEERESLQIKVKYRKIVKVVDNSPKGVFKRVVLRLIRGVYKKEVKEMIKEKQVSEEKSKLKPVTEEQRRLMERLLEEQEKLIVTVILLEAQLKGERPVKHIE